MPPPLPTLPTLLLLLLLLLPLPPPLPSLNTLEMRLMSSWGTAKGADCSEPATVSLSVPPLVATEAAAASSTE